MASQFFTQPFVKAQIKENIKAPLHWPLWGESTDDGEFPAQRASNAEKVYIWWHHALVTWGKARLYLRAPLLTFHLWLLHGWIITTHPILWDMMTHHNLNSLAPGKFEWNFRYVIFKRILVIDVWGISCWIALIWMPLGFTDDKSTWVQVMAWCRQATSHYLSQCWPRSLSPYSVSRPQWVKWSLQTYVLDEMHEMPRNTFAGKSTLFR